MPLVSLEMIIPSFLQEVADLLLVLYNLILAVWNPELFELPLIGGILEILVSVSQLVR